MASRSALAKPARTTSERPPPSQAMASMKPSEASSQKRLGNSRTAARRDPRCASRRWRKRDGREAVMAGQREQLLGEAEEGDEVHEAEEAKEDEAGEPVRR